MTSNRHIVDQLADVRAQIKMLQESEKDLKDAICDAMGHADSLGGDEWIALQRISERKGAIDTKALEKAGIDVEAFRKPPTVVYQIVTERRVQEDA